MSWCRIEIEQKSFLQGSLPYWQIIEHRSAHCVIWAECKILSTQIVTALLTLKELKCRRII